MYLPGMDVLNGRRTRLSLNHVRLQHNFDVLIAEILPHTIRKDVEILRRGNELRRCLRAIAAKTSEHKQDTPRGGIAETRDECVILSAGVRKGRVACPADIWFLAIDDRCVALRRKMEA